MSSVLKVLVSGLVQVGALAVLLFAPAQTLHYWQGWAFLLVFALSTWIPSIYLARTNPVAFERRTRGGPVAEGRRAQKLAMAGLYLSLAAMVVVSAFDHRFGWSSVPAAVCVAGEALVALGLILVVLVIVQNSYASTTVRVETSQTVISSGLYGMVRHPMYTGNVIMMIGIPLALGSYVGLVFVVPGLAVLASRIRDEEKLLGAELSGYREYTQKVRYRLVPCMW
jgi:protein-S-isoprenylcysteine O-methyltransferase Ste14